MARKRGRKPNRVSVAPLPESIRGVRLSDDDRIAIGKALAPLNPREQMFVLEFWNCLVVSKASRAAGYADSTAHTDSYRHLEKPRIAQAMLTIRDIVHAAKVITPQRRRELLSQNAEEILNADPGDYIEGGKDGGWVNFGKESPNRRVVRGITSKTTEKGAVITEIKLARPSEGVSCIKELNEMDGLYPKDKAQKDLFEALKSANGIQFVVDLSGKKGAKS